MTVEISEADRLRRSLTEADSVADTVIGEVAGRGIVDDTIIRSPRGIPSRAPRVAAGPAPALYRVRVNDGGPLALDQDVVVGRAPKPPRVATGAPPRFVTVPSPRHEVSATHLRIHQDGSSVIITDLHSTNGTVITTLGSVPASMSPGDSIVAGPGTLVDIGDGNVIEILATARIVPPDHESSERPGR